MVKNCSHVHFVGIGGVSTSALAQWLVANGKKVTGSDKTKSVFTFAKGLFTLTISLRNFTSIYLLYLLFSTFAEILSRKKQSNKSFHLYLHDFYAIVLAGRIY